MKLAKDFPILKAELEMAAAGSASNVNKLRRLTGTEPPVAEETSGIKGDNFRLLITDSSICPSALFPFHFG